MPGVLPKTAAPYIDLGWIGVERCESVLQAKWALKEVKTRSPGRPAVAERSWEVQRGGQRWIKNREKGTASNWRGWGGEPQCECRDFLSQKCYEIERRGLLTGCTYIMPQRKAKKRTRPEAWGISGKIKVFRETRAVPTHLPHEIHLHSTATWQHKIEFYFSRLQSSVLGWLYRVWSAMSSPLCTSLTSF